MDSNWDDTAEQRALPPPRSSARLIGLFLTLAVVIVLVVVVRRFAPQQNPTAAPAVGQVFAKLQLEPLEESGAALTEADLSGKVTLINFWGPWCPPCRAEFPELMNLREKFSQQPKFRFVSVTCSADSNEAKLPQETRAYLSSQGYDLPVHRDPTMATRLELLRLNRSEGFAYPTTVLIDQQGVVRGLWIGYRQGVVEQMQNNIELLLQEKPDEGGKGSGA